MRPLRYSINVTLDGFCDHRAFTPGEDIHRHAAENLDRADALLLGRVTYEMTESGWRTPALAGTRTPWMEPFAETMFPGLSTRVDLTPVGRLQLDSGVVATRYEPRR